MLRRRSGNTVHTDALCLLEGPHSFFDRRGIFICHASAVVSPVFQSLHQIFHSSSRVADLQRAITGLHLGGTGSDHGACRRFGRFGRGRGRSVGVDNAHITSVDISHPQRVVPYIIPGDALHRAWLAVVGHYRTLGLDFSDQGRISGLDPQIHVRRSRHDIAGCIGICAAGC